MALFIYGTLRDPDIMARIAGQNPGLGSPAVLHDHVVLRQADAPLPYLARATGQRAEGILFSDLTDIQVQRLDLYETPFGYTAEPVVVDVNGQSISALAYFPADGIKVTDQQWDMAEWEAELGPLSREMAKEIGQYDPPLSGHRLAWQWAMIAKRATARLLASSTPKPTSIRYDPTESDIAIAETSQLSGDFFKAGAVHFSHRTFTGRMSETLTREFFLGTDAAMVLPYDPETDRVLLVEQIRIGPLMRRDPNPWMLEPVAGMIDAGEAPEMAALRETQEEAGLTGVTLEFMSRYYASPGDTTDYFYCYLGLCDLPDTKSYRGGVADEHEDLRLHIMSFDGAMGLLETGEIEVGPLVMMLLWLDRYRAKLRSGS